MKSSNRNLLIIHRAQYGYHTDVYKWCTYLREDYNISTLSFDGKPRIYTEGVRNLYVSSKIRGRTFRGLVFIARAIITILFFKGIVIVCYFPHCNIIGLLFGRRRILLDFRTMSILPNENLRAEENRLIKKAAKSFNSISAISEGVARQLCLGEKKVSILPLGADSVFTGEKDYHELHLLYVGTFDYRHLEQTIIGFKLALDELPDSALVTYDIVGDGRHGELQEYMNLVDSLELHGTVRLHGYVQHDDLDVFYERCNVGVSYVPMTEWFDYQPVTKTFEYGLSGLFTIATKTYSNEQVITSGNGLLIEDTARSFADAIKQLYFCREGISSSEIRLSMRAYSWDRIVNNYLKPILNRL